jgi:hypothetical protein
MVCTGRAGPLGSVGFLCIALRGVALESRTIHSFNERLNT